MGFNAAIGNGQLVTALAVAQQHVMGADPAGGKTANATVPLRDLPNADHATGIFIVILSREQAAAIPREQAMTIKVVPLRRLQTGQMGAIPAVDDIGKAPRAAGKGYGLGAEGMGGGGMAAPRQRAGKAQRPGFRQSGQQVAPTGIFGSRQKGRAAKVSPTGGRGQASGQ